VNALRNLGLPFLLGAALVSPAAGALPPITAADWAAKAPANDPTARALVLYKRGEIELMDPRQEQVASSLRIEQRIKLLTREGLEEAELEIAHGRRLRLQSLTGRTLLPDGRVLPLSAEAKFERRLSTKRKSWVTAVAFPGVEVGAIVEYEAVLRFDTFLFLEPWFLSELVPVVYSEVIFSLPKSINVFPWGRDPFKVGLQTETTTDHRVTLRVWARDLPAIPIEPLGPPFAELATQYGIVATAYLHSQVERLFDSWQGTADYFEEWIYGPARRKDRGVAQRAKQLVGGERDPGKKAELLYRFVRDEIRTERETGITLADDKGVGEVLARGEGDYAAKALLLQVMLDAVGVPARLVWANERSTGYALLDVPSPDWFERVLVAVDLPAGRVFLEPGERELAFGALPAEVEASQAVLVDRKKPEVVQLPALAVEANRRSAKVVLAVDEEGRISGSGDLLFTGQHAVSAMAAAAASTEGNAWQRWLEDRLPGFEVEAVETATDVDGGQARLTWRMGQPAEEVLGDEASLTPSLPLGPVTQFLTLAPDKRRTPVVYPFPDRDELTLELTYPAGWRVEELPPPAQTTNPAGAFVVTSANEEATRTVRFQRRLDITMREATDRAGYVNLQALLAATAQHDAQRLGLARR
jgi:hypothetical protein